MVFAFLLLLFLSSHPHCFQNECSAFHKYAEKNGEPKSECVGAMSLSRIKSSFFRRFFSGFFRSFLPLVVSPNRHFGTILMIEIMIKIIVTVFNFSYSASLLHGSEPLEMRKVEMGNGIGCITWGGRENVAKTGDQAGWFSLLPTPLFRPSHLYPLPSCDPLLPVNVTATEGASNSFDLSVNWRRYVRTRERRKSFRIIRHVVKKFLGINFLMSYDYLGEYVRRISSN